MKTKLAFDPEELRREIAEVIANEVKSYNIPSICARFSIQKTVDEADALEAHSSKRLVRQSASIRPQPESTANNSC